MKLQKIVVLHEEENRIEEIDIMDGTFLFVENKEQGRVITSVSNNSTNITMLGAWISQPTAAMC